VAPPARYAVPIIDYDTKTALIATSTVALTVLSRFEGSASNYMSYLLQRIESDLGCHFAFTT